MKKWWKKISVLLLGTGTSISAVSCNGEKPKVAPTKNLNSLNPPSISITNIPKGDITAFINHLT